MANRRIVFAGPSINSGDINAICPAAEILEPIRAGDLFKLRLDPSDAVLIVDGYFKDCPPIRHKEILHHLSLGVTFLGAASMGALRAAELCVYGMRGVGRIFESYHDGLIVGDDEVAVAHGPAEFGYPCFSVALVNLRFAAESLIARGLLKEDAIQVAIERVRQLAFFDRTREVVTTICLENIDRALVDELVEVSISLDRNQKNRDALQAVEALHSLPSSANQTQQLTVHRTFHLTKWQFDAQHFELHGAKIINGEALSAAQLFSLSYPDIHRTAIASAILFGEREDDDQQTSSIDSQKLRALLNCGAADPITWCAANGLSRADVARLEERSHRLAATRADEVQRELKARLLSFLVDRGHCPRETLPASWNNWLLPDEAEDDLQTKVANVLARSSCHGSLSRWRSAAVRELKARGGFLAAAEHVKFAAELSLELKRVGPLDPDTLQMLFSHLWRCRNGSFELALWSRGLRNLRQLSEQAYPFTAMLHLSRVQSGIIDLK